jgi:hypothetical protein
MQQQHEHIGKISPAHTADTIHFVFIRKSPFKKKMPGLSLRCSIDSKME